MCRRKPRSRRDAGISLVRHGARSVRPNRAGQASPLAVLQLDDPFLLPLLNQPAEVLDHQVHLGGSVGETLVELGIDSR